MFFPLKPDKFINLYDIGNLYERINQKVNLRFGRDSICHE